MSRSFDISRRRKSPPPPPSHSSGSSRRKRSSGAWLFILFLIGVGAILFATQSPGFFSPASNSSKGVVHSTTTTPTKSTSNPSATPTPTISPTLITNGLKIQILNGTGTDSVMDQVKKLLEDNKYTVSSTSQAKYTYDNTVIYYRKDALETANNLAKILSPYKPTISESQISGLFDILVIIGKQNLPTSN